MKKIFLLLVCNYYEYPFQMEARLDNGEAIVFTSYSQLSGYDTSGLRILDVTNNKAGKFTSYSAADFIGRENRISFTF